MTLLLTLLTLGFVGGCEGGDRNVHVAPAHDAATARVAADWDDVEVAVRFGLARSEMAAIRIDRSRPEEIRFELRSSRDEPGVLTASREGVGEPITLACTIGRFGDAERERDLLRVVGRRLEQLRGVEIAPERD